MNKITIAIDGHSSTGKSTAAKALAKHLGYTYIDSGAMYRCVTLFAMQNNWAGNKTVDAESLVQQLRSCNIEFRRVEELQHAFLNGKDVESKIRSLEVSQNVSPVATIKEVREYLVQQQQQMGTNKGIVMDGRDIGTVVFPEAELKVFMTASAQVRAQRRYDEMLSKGEKNSFESVLENVKERDTIDENRAESPLRKADDALTLDNSNISKAEQLTWLQQQAKTAIAKANS